MRIPKRLLCFGLLILILGGCNQKPDNIPECLNAAAVAAASGNYTTAFGLTSQAVKLAEKRRQSTDEPTLWVFHAIMAERCGKIELALDYAKRAYKQKRSFIANYTLGRLYAEDPNRRSEAQQLLDDALAVRPGNVNTLKILTNLALDAQNWPAAENYLNQLLNAQSSQGNQLAFCNAMALAKLGQGDQDGAKSWFGAARRIDRSNLQVLLNLAIFNDYYAKQPRSAAQLYRDFLKQSDNKTIYREIANKVQKRLAALEAQIPGI